MQEESKVAISQRFVAAVNQLLEQGIISSYREFCEKIGIKPSSFNDIKSGRGRYVTIEMIHNSCNVYPISVNYVLFDKGQPTIAQGSAAQAPPNPISTTIKGINSAESATNIHKKETSTQKTDSTPSWAKKQEGGQQIKVRPIVVTVDNQGRNNIVEIDARAAAGFPANHDNPEFFQTLPSFSLPGSQFQQGTYISIQVVGDSMHPTIYHNDWLVAQFLDDYEQIREGYVHVVVTPDGVVAKRLLNRIDRRGKVVLMSDNETYPTYEEPIENVLQIWRVEAKLSFNLRNESADLRRDVNSLKADIIEIKSRVGL